MMKYFPSNIRTKQGYSLSSLLFSTINGSPSEHNKVKHRNTRYTDWKGRNEIAPILRQHDFLCRKFQSTKSESQFSKVIVYKVNPQKLIIFLYTTHTTFIYYSYFYILLINNWKLAFKKKPHDTLK